MKYKKYSYSSAGLMMMTICFYFSIILVTFCSPKIYHFYEKKLNEIGSDIYLLPVFCSWILSALLYYFFYAYNIWLVFSYTQLMRKEEPSNEGLMKEVSELAAPNINSFYQG
jgi:hypothetical protein